MASSVGDSTTGRWRLVAIRRALHRRAVRATVTLGAGILLVGGNVSTTPAAELATPEIRPFVARSYLETTIGRPDLRPGWLRISSDRYTFGLPGDVFVITATDLGTEPGRSRLADTWPGDQEVLAALEVRVRDERLAVLAVQLPWTPGSATLTMRIASGPVSGELLEQTRAALSADGAAPRWVDGRPGFLINGHVGTVEVHSTVGDHQVITQEGGRAVSAAYLMLADSHRLELAVTAAAGDPALASDLADTILASWFPR